MGSSQNKIEKKTLHLYRAIACFINKVQQVVFGSLFFQRRFRKVVFRISLVVIGNMYRRIQEKKKNRKWLMLIDLWAFGKVDVMGLFFRFYQ